MAHGRREEPIELVCSGGCGKKVRIRPSKIQKADFYVCNSACEKKLPTPLPGLIKKVIFGAAAGFTGITYVTQRQEAEERAAQQAADDARARKSGAATSDELAALVQEIDDQACLAECVYLGRGIYAFKLYTAVGGYLTEGRQKDILDLVRRDKAARAALACPFCHTKMSMDDDACPNCGAIHDRDGGQLIDRLLPGMTITDITAMLSSLSDCFKQTPGLQRVWARMPDRNRGAALDMACRKVTGPGDCNNPAVIQVPVFIDEDMAGAEAERLSAKGSITLDDLAGELEDLVRLPSCEYCTHAFELDNHEGGCYETLHYCVFPMLKHEFAADFPKDQYSGEPLGFSEEHDRYYEANDFARFVNPLLQIFLKKRLTEVDHPNWLGYAEGAFQAIHGPICPHFKLDTSHVDLGEYSHYRVATATVPIRFGKK